jgi:signal transduction histidine kinase/DNA-binding response OmpR family regulator/ligand-binding sensor domain-containing protein
VSSFELGTSTRHFARAHRWLALGLAAGLAHADGPFEPLDDGLVLSQSSVRAMAQDAKGYLWIGTQAGLDRYDGYSIRSWKSRPGDPHSLSPGFVNALLVGSDDTLWVGTGSGLDRLDPGTRRVTRLPVQLDDGSRSRGSIGSIVEDRAGRIFAVSDSGLDPVRWLPGRRVLQPVPIDGAAESGDGPRSNARLLRDARGRIWLAARQGLWRLNRTSGRFRPVVRPQRVSTAAWLTEHIAAAGPGDGIAYASMDGLYLVDPDAEKPVRLLRPTAHGLDSDWVRAVAVDATGAVWIAQTGAPVRIDIASGRWQTFDGPRIERDRSDDADLHAVHVAETPNGELWLAGLFGLLRHDAATGTLRAFRHDPRDPTTPPPTLAAIGYRIFVDRFGVLWVGGDLGGLARRGPHSERFAHVHDLAPSATSRNIIRAIAEQTTRRTTFVWTANQNHGVTAWRRVAPRDYRIEHRYPADGAISRIGDVRHITVDPGDNSVWLAGRLGLARVAEPGAPLGVLEAGEANAPFDVKFADFLDDGRLAAAGSRNGRPALWIIDTGGDAPRIVDRIVDNANGIDDGIGNRIDNPVDPGGNEPRPRIFHFVQRADGDLVAAAGSGITIIDLDRGEFSHHAPLPDARIGFDDRVFMLASDGRGGLWAGTRGAGLLHVRFIGADQPVFSRVTADDGLPDETVYAVLREADGVLWLSTNRGIVRFEPDPPSFAQYTPGDGTQDWEFNHTVAHIGASGRFYFGGVSGWNVFRPEDVRPLLQPPGLDLTGVRINDRSLEPVPDGRLPTLTHDLNRVAIDYVALHFADPQRIRYEVRLIGVDEGWVPVGDSRRARYASLAPGRYRFEARAANLDGIWSAPRSLLRFEIRQPPWLTPWAWAAYAIAAVLVMLALAAQQRHRRRRMQSLIKRRTAQLREQKSLVDRQARELQRALEARTTLFANISHEFRTPLTLVRASIDRLAERPDEAAAATGRRYVARLLRLVEQLLDLSRLRLATPSTTEPAWRLDAVIRQTVDAFRPVAQRRGIDIESDIDGAWMVRCRQELVEKILLNLLGNALKFTPPGGRVDVSLAAADDGVRLTVADTGPGIPEHEQQLIFERFYRTPVSERERHAGAGIGLALVHEATRAAAGRIEVVSRPGDGARFVVTLPAARAEPGNAGMPNPVDHERQQLDLDALASERDDAPPTVHAPAAEPPAADAEATLLIVEDNADLRRHLAETLTARWRVLEAADGAQGYRMARRHGPDLIVTDLMMPDVDGFEMLAQLRADVETSHIPVLFLTARQDDETRLRAFALSADGFMSKPFRAGELTIRIEQMLGQRARLHDHLRDRLGKPPGADAPLAPARDDLSDRDRSLLEALDQWLARHHADAGADVQAMASALHVTPRTLQRKLRALADTTPATYLRDYRMARARELLGNPRLTITEVALAVGYSSSQYFSRAFRQAHGEPPETWRRRKKACSE